MIQAVQPESSARGVAWDLGDLYKGVDDPQLGKDLEAALGRARTFEDTYRGKIGTEQGPEADLLLAAVRELESLSEQMERPAFSHWEAEGTLGQRIQGKRLVDLLQQLLKSLAGRC